MVSIVTLNVVMLSVFAPPIRMSKRTFRRSCLVWRASLAPKAPSCATLSNDCKISAAFSRNEPALAMPPCMQSHLTLFLH